MDKNYRVIFPERSKVVLEECKMPTIGDDEILVKSEVSQISTGTELTRLEANVEPGTPWAKEISYPIMKVGYSVVGKVVAAGKDVSPDVIGKRVFMLHPHKKYNKVKADSYEGVMWVPEGVEPDEAVFAAIAQITNGSIRGANIKPGDACVVYGAGLIGQMVARFAKVAGSTKIFVADVSDLRLNMLPDDPCFVKLNSREVNVPEYVQKVMANDKGVPFVFETTSVPSLVEEELKCLCKYGKLIVTSSPKGKSVVDLDYVSRMGITIVGAHNYAMHPNLETFMNRWTRRRDSDFFLELLEKKQMTVKEMNTHRYHYTDAVAAYEMLMKDRTQALSVLIDWED